MRLTRLDFLILAFLAQICGASAPVPSTHRLQLYVCNIQKTAQSIAFEFKSRFGTVKKIVGYREPAAVADLAGFNAINFSLGEIGSSPVVGISLSFREKTIELINQKLNCLNEVEFVIQLDGIIISKFDKLVWQSVLDSSGHMFIALEPQGECDTKIQALAGELNRIARQK